MFCKFCDKPVSENSSFCKHCGAKISDSITEELPDAVQETQSEAEALPTDSQETYSETEEVSNENLVVNQQQTPKTQRELEMELILKETSEASGGVAHGPILLLMWVQFIFNILAAISVFAKAYVISSILGSEKYSVLTIRDSIDGISKFVNDINILNSETFESFANKLQITSYVVLAAVIIGFLYLIAAVFCLFSKKNHESFIKKSEYSLLAFLISHGVIIFMFGILSNSWVKDFVEIGGLPSFSILAAVLGIVISKFIIKKLD